MKENRSNKTRRRKRDTKGDYTPHCTCTSRRVSEKRDSALPAVMNHNRGTSGQAENIVTTREGCGQYKTALRQFADKVVEYNRHWVRGAGGLHPRATPSVAPLRFA
jgi:2'-5' RNA ligase